MASGSSRFNPQALRRARLRRKLSLRRFAAVIGCSGQFIFQLEAGQARPTVRFLERLAIAHRINLRSLFTEGDRG